MELLSIKEASRWASEFLQKNVTESNISYLISYGRIPKKGENGTVVIAKEDLKKYYNSYFGKKEVDWKKKLGNDLNWALSFDYLKEADTTKHVHRLHPYKGKFIPQLVQYFLDDHTDDFKKEVYFKTGDIILDPFCGSGTALVQANELEMHAIGIEVSYFNTLISNVKLKEYDLNDVQNEINRIDGKLNGFLEDSHVLEFDEKITSELNKFNSNYYPAPDFRYKVNQGKINEWDYVNENFKTIKTIYNNLVKKYNIKLRQDNQNTFLDIWYLQPVRREFEFVFEIIKEVKNQDTKKILTVILSRTIRSCRATTHSDLATLIDPVDTVYYCSKHNKVCKPLFSIKKMWDRYTKDTVKRLYDFKKVRTDTMQLCLTGNSRKFDIVKELEKRNKDFSKLVKNNKISGIFSSPPYVGLIDYHEQHAYAYNLFGFDRNDELEIGPLSKGQGREARESYVNSIAQVLNNCKKYFKKDYNVFLVANDKYNLYPKIAEKAGMRIVNQFKRPVLNRTEKDKGAYSEIIFHMKGF